MSFLVGTDIKASNNFRYNKQMIDLCAMDILGNNRKPEFEVISVFPADNG